LELRFGAKAAPIVDRIGRLASASLLEKVLRAAKTVDRPEDLARIWETPLEGRDAY